MSESVKRIIIIGVIGVIGIFIAVACSNSVKDQEVVTKGFMEEQMEAEQNNKERHDRVMNEKNEWQKKREADMDSLREETFNEISKTEDTVTSLKNELGTLVNEDLSIPPQNESRVRYIVGELNEILGMDMKVENGYLVAYKSTY